MRKVFFSFHFGRDAWRAGQVRNSGRFTGDDSGFIDKAEWEKVKLKGKSHICNWIDEQMKGTSVTVVLIGAETSTREYVEYEIKKSFAKGNGVIGIYIHNVKNQYGQTDCKGKNPFENIYYEHQGRRVYLSEIYKTYDWVWDNGRENMSKWIEEAAQRASR
ncbi:MAG: TIR domain-containing protein [Clostridium septicum]|uniref:TIR domain-containing protein n=1 Tax=Clostridium septicum TaxID=1504 RepID=UPI0028FFB3ED|nr:TIR domain-containing protein [Clostridium septicum]MDU1312480.1 TIR domain-containing protein [Clostridium septicum]